MIVIACYNVEGKPFIERCVASCRKFMSSERVVVIDGDSPDLSYVKPVRAMGAAVLLLKNHWYEAGAWWSAYRLFPQEQRFFFLQDSTELTAPLPFAGVLTVPAYLDHNAGMSTVHHTIVTDHLALTDYDMPMAWKGVSGNMFFCDRSILDKLAARRFDVALPHDKRGSEAWERLWGIAFGIEGFDVQLHSWGSGEELYVPGKHALTKFSGRRP